VEVTTWEDLKTQCEAGGAVVSLAVSFPVDSYLLTGEIVVSAGKTCVIQGNGKTLDAGGGGRFFQVNGIGSFLQVHNLALVNGNGAYNLYVSSQSAISKYHVLKVDVTPISARRTTWNNLQFDVSSATLLRSRRILTQSVSLGVGFHRHYDFSAQSDSFL
jgi:hypothetical protein